MPELAVIVTCYAKCWACMFDQHQDPPRVHGWADETDYEHAALTGQPSPDGPCGCWCVSHKAWTQANGRRHPRLAQIRTAYRRRRGAARG